VNAHTGRFPLVDSLRALAALSVLAYHVVFHLGAIPDGAALSVAAELNIGVPVFFVISGFLLYRPFVAARLSGEDPPHTGAYAVRRLLRVVPAYWVALVACVVLLGRWEVLEPRGIVTYFGFLQIYDADTIIGGIGPAWTLCVEVTFYAALPLWALLARRLPGPPVRAELIALPGLFACSLAWKWGVVHLVPADTPGWLPAQVSLPAFADHFALGMALAVISAAGAAPEVADFAARRSWAPWAAAGVLFAALSFVLREHGPDLELLGAHTARGLIGVLVLLPAVVVTGMPRETAVRRLLGSPLLLWLGLVSYGFYLWHWPLLLALQDAELGGWALTATVTVVATVAAAAVSWYAIERPAMRLGRRGSDHRGAGELLTADGVG
jgi:peptidoglycan/LPS O-acetylase OafA/YrhL